MYRGAIRFDSQAVKVLDGILQAALDFDHCRLPEVFAGCSRRQFAVLVRCPGRVPPAGMGRRMSERDPKS